ncbi:hypothetical protein AVEN_27851-1, partial [Araneus ventricosus]
MVDIRANVGQQEEIQETIK